MDITTTISEHCAPASRLCSASPRVTAIRPMSKVAGAHALPKPGHQTVSTEAGQAVFPTGSFWLYTQNFRTDDHFQRWRCAT
jgi:hypothetical protein